MGQRASAPAIVPVTGPPGAGKSSALLELDRRCPRLAHFAVRADGLALAARGDPLGLAMREKLLRQELLPDDLVRRQFARFLDNLLTTARVVAVEGYPRDTRQCEDLLEVVRERSACISAFVLVDVPDDVVRERVGKRRLCGRCGAPADQTATRCRGCGGPITRRRDDEASWLECRLADYREVSRGPQRYFAKHGLLRVLDGLMPPEAVRAALAGLLGIGAEALVETAAMAERSAHQRVDEPAD